MNSPSRPDSQMPAQTGSTANLRWLIAFSLIAATFGIDATGVKILPAPPELLPLTIWITELTDWFTVNFRVYFRAITWLLTGPLHAVRMVFDWLTWPSVIVLGAALGYAVKGPRLATFCVGALAYTVIFGYWPKTAVTLSMVAVAVPVSIMIGLFVGILAWRSPTARHVISPLTDLMQTVPTFAYLIPILVLFGIGPVVGMIASAIYAVPPIIHNVRLGLQRTHPEIVESAQMSGSTRGQLLWWVMIPAAMRTILVGVNQTVMAGLSMVVIASMVGGVDDIGIEVFQSMKQAKFGESFLSGLVIVVVAIILDRVSRGFAETSLDPSVRRPGPRFWTVIVATVLLLQALAVIIPQIAEYPQEWVLHLAPPFNRAMQWLTVGIFPVTSAIKTWIVFVVLLPLKIGFSDSVRPGFWGFEMGPRAVLAFAAVALLLVALAWRFGGKWLALWVAIGATLYFSGTTGVPWPAMAALVAGLAFAAGGARLAALVSAGLVFILVTGSWANVMISVQICLVGVALSFLIGTALGVTAALNDRFSALIAPVCDTLQTMPIFVFLIPAVMVFLVGEFTALIAIVTYAIVPSIRYAEHGVRNVPADIVEAARMIGTTRWQMLGQVQLPVAVPEIALDLNQTITMALAMVIVASLVGAQGLGTEVMIGLSRADTGRGLVAGLCVAIIAIIADRILQAWSASRKKALGLI